MSEFDFIVKRVGAVASIDLNRPQEGNTLTREMMTQLTQLSWGQTPRSTSWSLSLAVNSFAQAETAKASLAWE